MRDFKQLNLRYTAKKFDAVKMGKSEDETWEDYIFRKTVTEAKI